MFNIFKIYLVGLVLFSSSANAALMQFDFSGDIIGFVQIDHDATEVDTFGSETAFVDVDLSRDDGTCLMSSACSGLFDTASFAIWDDAPTLPGPWLYAIYLSSSTSIYFAGADHTFDLADATADSISLEGTIYIPGSSVFAGDDLNFSISRGYDISEIPEPSVLALMGLGIFGFGFARSRKIQA